MALTSLLYRDKEVFKGVKLEIDNSDSNNTNENCYLQKVFIQAQDITVYALPMANRNGRPHGPDNE